MTRGRAHVRRRIHCAKIALLRAVHGHQPGAPISRTRSPITSTKRSSPNSFRPEQVSPPVRILLHAAELFRRGSGKKKNSVVCGSPYMHVVKLISTYFSTHPPARREVCSGFDDSPPLPTLHDNICSPRHQSAHGMCCP
jgi:hypothetical protein